MSQTPPAVPESQRHLVAACLRDYATIVLVQQSIRNLPADVHKGYERIYGSPLDVETLAEDLRILASSIDHPEG